MTKLLFQHFVVLMLENRSFDHLFGYLGKGDGLPAGGMTNARQPGEDRSETFSSSRGGDYVAVGEGPSHSLKETNLQLFGSLRPDAAAEAAPPPLNGFVASFEMALRTKLKRQPTRNELQQVMNCFDPEQVPVLSTLARNFVLCDRWFADVPGPTMPNRAFVHAATSQGFTYNAAWHPEFTCDTLYDRINATAGMSWRVYYHDHNDVVQLYPRLETGVANHMLFEGGYVSDVANDRLATYSFIVPAYIGQGQHPINSMHPPTDVRPAEKLVSDVYAALKAHEAVWKKTLLIVLFDEHGGYPDHVPPPAAENPDGIEGRLDKPFLVPFGFRRLGLRVPAILVSPWFEPAVDHTVYSHASIPGSIIEALQLQGGFLTRRDQKAAKLTQRYLLDDGSRKWRPSPDLMVPPQPQPFDEIQREILDGTVNLDPHPERRDTMRTRDIQDAAQARQFMRTQVAKHLEHRVASRGQPALADEITADRQLPSTTISPSRIAELRSAIPKP